VASKKEKTHMDDFDMQQEERMWPTIEEPENDSCLDDYTEPDESMDGDMETGLASAGFGTDEDYGYFGGNDE